MQRTVLSIVLVLAGAWAANVIAGRQARQVSHAPPTGLPDGRIELFEALPFVLDEPFVHEWRREKPLVSSGMLLVLKVPADLARPRQTYESVLYVGDQTAERCNFPEDGEFLVVLVPAPTDASGAVQLDLAETPIWFGSLELPEQVDAVRIARERASALAQGLGPARRNPGAHLRSSAADTVHVRRRVELDPYLADWIERYSPTEVDLVAQLRR
jgi:hypothetical protein